MIEVEEIQKLDNDSLIELYEQIKEHIQYLESNLVDTSLEEGDDEDE